MSQIKLIEEASYDKLPATLGEFCKIGPSEALKDLLLISSLGTLSGCLQNWGVYDNRKAFPNLFVIIIGRAGSGKGIISHAKSIADKYDERLEKLPNTPNRVLIPGNASAFAVYEALHTNGGGGLIFETEIDTLSQALKQDWGSFSDLIRKAYQQESASLLRRAEPKLIKINEPRLAAVLSGSRDQLQPFVSSVENGLFSRLTFVFGKALRKWRNVSPQGQNVNLNSIESLVQNLVAALEYNDRYQFEMTLAHEHWEVLNNHFESLLNASTLPADDLDASIVRLGLMTFKICITLTSIRRFDTRNQSSTQECHDDDFDIALELADNLFKHVELVFGIYRHGLPSESSPILKFLSWMPDEFQRAEAVEIGSRNMIRERTVGKYLAILLRKNLLEKPRPGFYKKVVV